LWLAAGFVLGIATVDAVIGALFGLLGFAVLRTIVGFLSIAYALLAGMLLVIGLALLRVIHISIPVLNPTQRPAQGLLGAYLLGLPFGISTCPACTPLILPIVLAAAASADPLLGATLMFTFGLARGVPIMLAGFATGFIKGLRGSGRYIVWIERAGGVLMLATASYFLYQAAIYGGWITPP
jgi:cytochrome c-type biogenesis protein